MNRDNSEGNIVMSMKALHIFHLLWVVLNVMFVDWSGQRVLLGYAVTTTVYCVSTWSPCNCPVVPACLGTMTLPFAHETTNV